MMSDEWTRSAIADRLYSEMNQWDENQEPFSEQKKYYAYALQYANRRAYCEKASDFQDVFHVYMLTFSEELRDHIKRLDEDTLNEVISEAVKRIIKAKRPEVFRDYLQFEPLRWDLINGDGNGKGDSSLIAEHVTGTKSDTEEEGLTIIQRLGKKIMKKYTFVTTTKDEELFCYDTGKGIYSPDTEWLIRKECREMYSKIKGHETEEVIKFVKESSTYVDRSIFDSNPDVLNLQNGQLNIHTLKFEDHSSEEYCLSQIPIKYDPKARCPKFTTFLIQILKAKDIATALEFIGYCLYRTAKYQKALMCVGKGDNGKSTLLQAIERCVSEENTSNATLQELSGGDPFATADLFGKLINTFADLKSDKLTKGGSGKFKVLVSGDRTPAQKKYGQRFYFRNHAKLIFSCNDIPESDDDGYAYFKRWIILHFERVFSGEDKDVNLIDKITTEQEKSGILNLALAALRRLIKNGGFAGTDDIETVREDYIKNSADVERFLMEKCDITKSVEDRIICRDLWGVYLSYCKDLGITSKDDKTFGMELLTKHIIKDQIQVNYERSFYYVGIKLKEKV
jgi:P4 family phage/plasmid primase-like protien